MKKSENITIIHISISPFFQIFKIFNMLFLLFYDDSVLHNKTKMHLVLVILFARCISLRNTVVAH